MFSKISRYRKLADVVMTDAKGRKLASKSLRLLPEVSGTFLHTVTEGDRLDHLAYKYYKQPRKWWRICDANPEFMSPQALLGKEPIVTTRFPLIFNDDQGQPPWAKLLEKLPKMVGVEDLKVEEEVVLVEEARMVGERRITVYVEQFKRAVIVTYNQMNVSAEALAAAISDVGFEVGEPGNIGRVGKQIVIPPDTVR
jgi:hypothetical protein